MASVPHFYFDYQFSPEGFSNITSAIAQDGTFVSTSTPPISCGAISTTASAMLGPEQNQPYHGGLECLYDNNGGFECFPVEYDILSRVPMTTATPFTEQLGVSELEVPSFMDYKMGFSGLGKIQNFGGRFQYSDTYEYGEDCCGFLQNGKSVSPDSGENWRIQCNQMPVIEHTNIKVGRYTVEERKDRILRYLKKRNQRNFNKTIKYACRKTLADRRVRIRGRFARNNELCEDEIIEKKSENPLQEKDSYSNDAFEMKNEDDDDDDWVQEAVASLIYVPYIAG